MTSSVLPRAVLALAFAGVAAAISRGSAARTRAVRRAFDAWGTGTGSIYDLIDTATEIVLPGTSMHCGSYRRDDFLGQVAAPFMSRFSQPPVPQLRALWSNRRSVAALAEARGVTRLGHAYANVYVFVFEFAGKRVTRLTEFLDMAAFNSVWDETLSASPDVG